MLGVAVSLDHKYDSFRGLRYLIMFAGACLGWGVQSKNIRLLFSDDKLRLISMRGFWRDYTSN